MRGGKTTLEPHNETCFDKFHIRLDVKTAFLAENVVLEEIIIFLLEQHVNSIMTQHILQQHPLPVSSVL